MPSAVLPARAAELLRLAVVRAARAGESIMGQVLARARQTLHERATQARNPRDRDELAMGLKLLDAHADLLVERYPAALEAAFAHPDVSAGGAVLVLAELHFDALELMEVGQEQSGADLARAQQDTLLAVDAALADLNCFMATILGLSAAAPERNPLRPDVFVLVLQHLLVQTQAPQAVRAEWLRHMSGPLGQALNALYKSLSVDFQKNGVVALGAATTSTVAAPVDKSLTPVPETALTLERLRGLLLGEPNSAPTDFEPTLPAALEALQEMKQVDQMMERLGQGPDRAIAPDAAASSLSPRTAQGLGHALSLEVVALMVDNMARDARLLAPVKALVKSLEPALQSLARVDRRFFSDKLHPARQLLQEITHRSVAFESAQGLVFDRFLAQVKRAVSPLKTQTIVSAQPFEDALQALLLSCKASATSGLREKAERALQQAEARHLLAEQIGQDIAGRSEAAPLDPRVLGFMTGPWAQVIAQAHLSNTSESADPGHYREWVAALAWSAQPAKTSQNIDRLTQMVPKLLAKLREGLALIDYPAVKTSAFFDVLMKLHQQAFRPVVEVVEPPKPVGLLPSLLQDDDLWLAPAEAKVSGFMSLPEEATELAAPVLRRGTGKPLAGRASSADLPVPRPDALADSELAVGTWVELWVNEAWVRTQISWASPHGTLFLFTSALGSTQSMTRRSRDRMWAQGSLRPVSGRLVDDALDAVFQTAVRNSLSLKL